MEIDTHGDSNPSQPILPSSLCGGTTAGLSLPTPFSGGPCSRTFSTRATLASGSQASSGPAQVGHSMLSNVYTAGPLVRKDLSGLHKQL